MQNIVFYVTADSVIGEVKDYMNASRNSSPVLVKDCATCLKMRIFARNSGVQPYPIESLSSVVSWQFVMDSDFNDSTNHILQADNANITVESVVDIVNDTENTYTEISIPIINTNTVELSSWIGNAKSKSGLNGELVGYDENANQVFVLQIEDFTIRNRIIATGDPTEIENNYLNTDQVRALISAGVEIEFSFDGQSAWHSEQYNNDKYLRVRSASDKNAHWSIPILLPAGATGETGATGENGQDGVSCYLYVAYASDNAGTDFSLVPSNSLKYRAEIQTQSEIENPGVTDFSDAVWIKYIGDTPTEFTQREPTRQVVYTAMEPNKLPINSNIIVNSTVNLFNTLSIDFTSVVDEDNVEYTAINGDYFKWEYHVTCSDVVSQITFTGASIGGGLQLINDANTVHVFSIRAIYSPNTGTNNLRFFCRYEYSYPA